ncbi:hypothetical protein N7516_002175 [Penicillium verrucosum]|uniref:uncharacterized protein n=1 Tax=Penicillium verrucosum TaxID=60171 RepID=UPI002544E5B3|nr:uncharacterized protein N7516_002175 [Penicillium verrucosum]KAJ5942007.1 hypothetical protein N7516_002175 [Penicillium verrucosum]
MDANTMENHKGLNTVVEDTVIADEASTTETGTGEPLPKKKKKSHSQAYYDRRKTQDFSRLLVRAIPLSPKGQEYILRQHDTEPQLVEAAEAAAEPSQTPPNYRYPPHQS